MANLKNEISQTGFLSSDMALKDLKWFNECISDFRSVNQMDHYTDFINGM